MIFEDTLPHVYTWRRKRVDQLSYEECADAKAYFDDGGGDIFDDWRCDIRLKHNFAAAVYERWASFKGQYHIEDAIRVSEKCRARL